MLFGHKEKIEIFKRLTKENNLGHAYLFYGETGVGKFTFAKSLAYFLEDGYFEIFTKPLIDYQEILSDSEKGIIGIDVIRQIKNFLFQKPFKSKKRLTVIDQAQTLTDEAQSALLKIVEEPPPSALIILIVNEPSLLLPSLLSRLTKVYFPRFSQKELVEILIANCNISKEKAWKIAADSFGQIGLALKLVDDGKIQTKTSTAAGVSVGEESLEQELNRRILELYRRDKVKNSAVLKWLLVKEWQAHVFNLNPVLQLRAIGEKWI